MVFQPIGTIHTAYKEKFGIPRQSMVVEEVKGQIYFHPPYDRAEYFKGIEDFTYIWLIWEFSEQKGRQHKATVRPPRLGGNERIGVFASRSPYRPNSIGISVVKLEEVYQDASGKVSLSVAGVDMLDGTPIIDIKPYIQSDIYPNAQSAYVDQVEWQKLAVVIPQDLGDQLPKQLYTQLQAILAEDPRPRTQADANKIYGMRFDAYDIHFSVRNGILTVEDISEIKSSKEF